MNSTDRIRGCLYKRDAEHVIGPLGPDNYRELVRKRQFKRLKETERHSLLVRFRQELS